MAALSAHRMTPKRDAGRGGVREFVPDAAVSIYRGAMVCIASDNDLVPGSTATTLACVGVAVTSTKDADYAVGDRIRVERGIFRFANSASTDAIALKDINATCYIVDDQTVALTNGSNTRSACGKIYDVDAQGVWVEI